jgi:NAD+ synthase (glutamine-hydrolysing)
VALAQINCTVGDLAGNVDKILDRLDQAREVRADLVCFPELAVTGYPPEDLLLKPSFLRENRRALERIVEGCRGLTAVVGFVDRSDEIYNAAAIIHDGRLAGVHHKMFLPNYGVFDEDRYFMMGRSLATYSLGEAVFGVGICEDLWYPAGPGYYQSLIGGAQILVNINASPFHAGKGVFREKMLATRASDGNCYVAYVNMVGGQDELVFDGQSLVVDPAGRVVARGRAFEEEMLVCDLDVEAVLRHRLADPRRRKGLAAFFPPGASEAAPAVERVTLEGPGPGPRPPLAPVLAEPPGTWEEIYRALVLGVRDYLGKNGFSHGVIGISGGVDSALTAAVAVDALGPERVVGVYMPSRFSSPMSTEDSRALAANLGIRLLEIPIDRTFEAYLEMLAQAFAGRPQDVTEENLQARIRGNILMALSNKFGWLVLTTGNKSEMACGYCTLYGDMAGGFAVIKDVPKTWVYQLCRWRNQRRPDIPERILAREPSAELRPDQKDTDTLPPYEVLDRILHLYVEEDLSPAGIVAQGFDEALVRRVIRMVDRNEYKRRQAAPGIKITPKAFGRDRRLPITNRYEPPVPGGSVS